MSGGLALVLACDLAGDGNELGRKTITRLLRAMEHHKVSGDTLAVAASFSPDFPKQREAMAVMMAEWLRQAGCTRMVVLRAETFNTLGELVVFYEYAYSCGAYPVSVITAPYHWRRMRRLIRRDFGPDKLTVTRFVPVLLDTPTKWERFVLEPLKLLLVYLPQGWRGRVVQIARAVGLK